MQQTLAPINQEKLSQLAIQLNETVGSVISSQAKQGFEKSFQIADAIGKLKEMLSPEYMKPIMALQNNRLGFKTDSADAPYPENVVKNCLIEAVLTGVQPFGNQFNIIASNCYITKEGFGYLLKKTSGLTYEIIPQLPRINGEKTSAAIVMEIVWTLNGNRQERKIDFPIRMNAKMGTDAVIGKATRKARAWLYNAIHDTEIADGEAETIDTEAKVVDMKADRKQKESERIGLLIKNAATIYDLETCYPYLEQFPEHLDNYTVKHDQLTAKK